MNYTSNNMEGGLCGLINFGATCYLNSILQALFNNNFILDNILINTNYTINDTYNENILIKILEQLLKDIWKNKCVLGPRPIIFTLSQIEKNDINEQNDPDEFYEKIITRLYEETHQNIEIDEDIWDTTFKKKNCFVNLNFYGLYKSEIFCNNCSNNSISYNPFISLKLEIVNNNMISCLKSHLSWENNITYTCEKCKCKNNCKKRFTIIKTPNVFVVTFKRYNNFNEKDNTSIEYPLQFEIDGIKLELYSIVNHFGPHIYCGHYTSYNKYLNDNNWYHIDDDSIEQININTIDKTNIYMLFYKRINS